MTAQEALDHFRYTRWASTRLLDAAKELSADALTKDLGISHTSILGTLAHTFFGDAVWYKRVVDPSLSNPDPKEVPPLEELDTQWRILLNKWVDWAACLTDGEMERAVAFRFMNGSPGENSLKQILLHVVNHATLHRGQVVALIRQAGLQPPGTDLIYYYRELAATA